MSNPEELKGRLTTAGQAANKEQREVMAAHTGEPTEDWERNFWRFMRERHEQIDGIISNPFLEKPLQIPQPCPTCCVDLKTVIEYSVLPFIRQQIVRELEWILDEIPKTPYWHDRIEARIKSLSKE